MKDIWINCLTNFSTYCWMVVHIDSDISMYQLCRRQNQDSQLKQAKRIFHNMKKKTYKIVEGSHCLRTGWASALSKWVVHNLFHKYIHSCNFSLSCFSKKFLAYEFYIFLPMLSLILLAAWYLTTCHAEPQQSITF